MSYQPVIHHLGLHIKCSAQLAMKENQSSVIREFLFYYRIRIGIAHSNFPAPPTPLPWAAKERCAGCTGIHPSPGKPE